MTTSFFVPGVPSPQGSKNAFTTGSGKVNLVESSRGLTEWRWRVGLAANQARRGTPLYAGAVRTSLVFVMPRPKALDRDDPTPPMVRPPDVDKLVRAVLDALTGTLLVDDSLVTDLGNTHKRYAEPAEPPGVHITVEAL